MRRTPGFSARRLRPEAIAPGVALILCALILGFLPGIIRPSATRIWKGYQVVLIRVGAGDADAMAAVTDRFGPGVLADTTASVEFWDFTGTAEVPVSQLADRIYFGDPRFDPFMEGLSRYFRIIDGSRQWRVAYVPARWSPFRTYLRLCGALGFPWRGSWRLEDFDPRAAFLAVACLAAFAFLLSLSLEKSRRTGTLLLVAAVVLWLPFLLAGGVARLALCTAIVGTWFPVVRVLILLHAWDGRLLREARRPLLLFGAVAAVGIALLAIVEGATLVLFVSFVLAIVASVLLVAGVARLWGRLPLARRRRAAFDPVPIVNTPSGASGIKFAAILIVVFGLLATGLIPLAGGVAVPTPLRTSGTRGISWQSLSAFSVQNNTRTLPDIADLVTHVAYQEALAFGRPWSFPRADERVYARDYIPSSSGGITARLRMVKVFDTVWLDSIWRRSSPGSLASLFLAQGRPVAVALRGPSHALFANITLAVLVLAALAAWLASERGAGPLIRGVQVRFNGVARRNQVP